MSFVTSTALHDYLNRLDGAVPRPGRLLLVGETTLLFEGWRTWIDEITLTAEVDAADRLAFDDAVHETARQMGLALWEEHPGDVIPLPDDAAARHRPIESGSMRRLTLAHFDPYSVAFRHVARGDEPDYHLV